MIHALITTGSGKIIVKKAPSFKALFEELATVRFISLVARDTDVWPNGRRKGS